MDRLEAAFAVFDIVRLDHFRAFHDYWRVPADAETARKGAWVLGPDMDFFRAAAHRFGNARLIAEDLGDIDEGVRTLLDNSCLPGMAVLQFAFGGDGNNPYLPHNHKPNQVLYAGTHDNDTSRGWYEKQSGPAQDQLRRYLRVNGQDISWDLVRACYRSVARLAIVTAQDLLQLGSEARMNTPGTAMGNWQWRLTPGQLEQLFVHADYLREIAALYGRLPVEKKSTTDEKNGK
jgi:4-alpha-glucanotransferase